ncbi:hypothetical protein LBMAG53_04210 [Planctomycetota bacterium]|nr:hypothetical protein LBMAG53_04210 [Planctomycetota bacterium]
MWLAPASRSTTLPVHHAGTAFTVSDPVLRRDGNLRLAGLPVPGYPDDPETLCTAARVLAETGGGEPYGPPLLWFSSPPDERPVSTWDTLVGTAITGMARPGAIAPGGQRLAVEDYRDLRAFVVAHTGPIRDLARSWSKAADAAKKQGYRVRPYWRLALLHRRLADGNLHPVAEVSVFIDR